MAPLKNAPVLITGGAGFFGSLLIQRLLSEGHTCVVIDLQDVEFRHERLIAIKGDIRDREGLARLFNKHRFKTVFHCAAILAHAVKDKTFLWESNVDGTRNTAEAAVKYGAQSIVFISSNCLWAENMGRPVREDDTPKPVEIYGQSKWEGEKICKPMAIESILSRSAARRSSARGGSAFSRSCSSSLPRDARSGSSAADTTGINSSTLRILASACIAAAEFPGSGIFNAWPDKVTSFRAVYGHVIEKAGTGACVASLPRAPALLAMRIAHRLGLSPLGPYQYRMISEDFVFDTSKIKKVLQWRPTLSNSEMLWLAYKYFHDNRGTIAARRSVSAHRQAARMGAIRLLKWVS